MILSGIEIAKRMGKDIIIEPFDENHIGPNSYDLTLDRILEVYEIDECLDIKKEFKTRQIIIPDEGLVLQPNTLYLGSTVERTKTLNYVPMLEGRSSIGRLGLSIHVTAGFGDIGFDGRWTLEISCLHPIRIYPNIRICQIYYHKIEGEYVLYNSKYQNNDGIQASRSYLDYKKG